MSETRLWIKRPLACLDPAAAGGIVVQGSRIVEQVAAGAVPADGWDRSFDASEHVLLPGLINTHHHFYQTLTRAYTAALNQPLFPWLKSLYRVWAGLTPESVCTATRLALIELLLSGCTTTADHHYVLPPGLEAAIDIQVEVARELGVRAILTRGSMSLGEEQGGLPPQSVVQDEETIVADCERLIGRYHDPSDGAMINIALAPCSPFSVSRELMRVTAGLAERHGVRLHTHLAETADETAYCERLFGQRPLDYLADVGWLSGHTWLAHGIHFTDAEIRRLAAAGVGIAHCPSSNMLLASGICPTLDLEAAGSPVGLAVDGSASNDHSSLIEEVRQALLLGRLRYGAERVTHQRVLHLATAGSAACLGRRDIGGLEVGQQADLALFRLDELRFSGAENPLAALVVVGAARADRVMVAGQWRVTDGEPVGVDLGRLRAEHAAAARRLWQRAG